MKRLVYTVILMLNIVICMHAQNENELNDPEKVVFELYDQVTFNAGELPDWDKVRSLFLDKATVILRTGPDTLSVFNKEGFVADFIYFIDNTPVKETGFIEKVINWESFVFGDIAHIFVVYEASVPGSGFKPQLGLDSFHLIKRYNGWKISSIINELPTNENPLPEKFKK